VATLGAVAYGCTGQHGVAPWRAYGPATAANAKPLVGTCVHGTGTTAGQVLVYKANANGTQGALVGTYKSLRAAHAANLKPGTVWRKLAHKAPA
jgi:hypothetical protein